MKHVSEYRDAAATRCLVDALHAETRRAWTIMEVCGGQTHAILQYGLDQLLPPSLELVHGPGCPVCVTPVERIHQALRLAERPDVTLCSYGDMLRVPGNGRDLLSAKAAGGDVRMVYSPREALDLARRRPDRQVVFFAVGFETTAPASAWVAEEARRERRTNFSLLVAHVRVPPAMDMLLAAPGRRVQGFLAAGHVCAVMGTAEYEPLAARHHVPVVVTGFEPLDILEGIRRCVRQLETGTARLENAYARVVRPEGNQAAQAILREVFETVPRAWRGIGVIPDSGFALRAAYQDLDAEARFELAPDETPEAPECLAGLVLQGQKKPPECPRFGNGCTPEHPLGATMVSAEGACAAYYRYRPPRRP